MPSKLRGTAVISLVIGTIVLVAWMYSLATVTVRDPENVVAEIVLQDDDCRIGSVRLPGGLHLAAAKIEGEAVVRCQNGKNVSLGYVTGFWQFRQTVRASDCRPGAPPVLP